MTWVRNEERRKEGEKKNPKAKRTTERQYQVGTGWSKHVKKEALHGVRLISDKCNVAKLGRESLQVEEYKGRMRLRWHQGREGARRESR